MINKKTVLCIFTAAALLGNVSPEVSAAVNNKGKISSEETALVFVQELGSEETEAKEVFAGILSEYTEETGTEIQWKTYPASEYRMKIEESFSEGSGPDVYMGSLPYMIEDFRSGRLHNFLYLYDQESSYAPGENWGDSLPDYVKDSMYISNKEVPGYPASFRIVRILCNTELFQAAHVEFPRSWEEFLDACEKLSASGVMPFAFPNSSWEDLPWQWMVNSLGNQVAGSSLDFLDVNEKDKGYVELNEFCKGVDKGEIDFGYENFLSPYVRMKEFISILPEETFGFTQEQALKAFAEGEAAMVMADNTFVSEFVDIEGLSVEAIPVPVITKETDENSMEKSVLCGGEPEMIYGIRSSLKKDGKKFDAAVDFVQYMTSEKVQKRLVEELYILPSNKNAVLPENLEGFSVTEEAPHILFFSGLNEKHSQELWGILKDYVLGELDDASFAEKVKQSYESAVKQIKELKGWDITNNYGMPTASECTMCAP